MRITSCLLFLQLLRSRPPCLAKQFLVNLGDEMIKNGSNPQPEIEKADSVKYGLEETASMESGLESEVKAGVDYSLSKKEKLCDFCKDWGFCRWCLMKCTQWEAQKTISRSTGVGVAKRPTLCIHCKRLKSVLEICGREKKPTGEAYAKRG